MPLSDVLSVVHSATPTEMRVAEQLPCGARAVAFSTTPGLLMLLRRKGAQSVLLWQRTDEVATGSFDSRTGVHACAELLLPSRGTVDVKRLKEPSIPGATPPELDDVISALLRAWCERVARERAAVDGGSLDSTAIAERAEALEQATEVVCALQLRNEAAAGES